MIAVYDESGASEIADIIVFAKGTIESPVVTKIIQIYEYDGEKLDKYRRNIYALERRGIQPKAGELFEIHRNTDFGSYVEFKKISGENARNNEQPGTYGRTSSTTTEGNIAKASIEFSSPEEATKTSKASRELDVIDYIDEQAEQEGRGRAEVLCFIFLDSLERSIGENAT